MELGPLTANCEGDAATPEMTRSPLPVLATVIGNALLVVPISKSPKLWVPGEMLA